MAKEINDLQFDVVVSTKKATMAINSLIKSLNILQDATIRLNNISFTGFLKNATKLATAMQKVNNVLGASNAGAVNISAFDKISSGLSRLARIKNTDFTALDSIIAKIPQIYTELNKIKPNENTTLVADSISKISGALSSLSTTTGNINVSAFDKLSNGLSRLSEIKNTDFTAIDAVIAKIPQIYAELSKIQPDSNVTSVATTLMNISKAFASLSTNANKASSALTTANARTNKLKDSNTALDISMVSLIYKFRTLYAIIQRVFSLVQSMLQLSVDFTENVNLFGVAIGSDFVAQADSFINAMEDAFGVDPNVLMRYQGVFMELNTAMGMTREQAYLISENFSKLAVDLSSLWNISEEEAFSKLQSGLAGLPRPLRQIGIDITENALTLTAQIEAEKAYAKGNVELGNQLSSSIEKWTRVQKQQMIYLTILRQTKDAQGDFSRTINQPANQLKILAMNFDKLKRAIGNLMYPLLSDILPKLNGLLMVLTDQFQKLAITLGYEMPNALDSALLAEKNLTDSAVSGLDGVSDETGSILDDVESIAKASQALSFDEFNTLTKQGSLIDLYAGFSGLDLTEYDNLMDIIDNKANEYYQKITAWVEKYNLSLDISKEKLEKILGVLGTIIGLNLLGKVVKFLTPMDGILKIFTTLGLKTLLIAGVLVAIGASIKYAWDTSETFRNTMTSLFDGIKTDLADIWKVLQPLFDTFIIPFTSGIINGAVLLVVGTFKTLTGLVSGIVSLINEMINGIARLLGLKEKNTQKVETTETWGTEIIIDQETGQYVEKQVLLYKTESRPNAKDSDYSLSDFGIGYIPTFATGGLPEKGSLFIANEQSPELIGNIGGQTAVVNNDQIVEAVASGVAQAVSKVLANSNSKQPLNVYLDGEVIYSNQKEISRNKGRNYNLGVFQR